MSLRKAYKAFKALCSTYSLLVVQQYLKTSVLGANFAAKFAAKGGTKDGSAV